MNKRDLHPDLQRSCVPVPGRSGCFSVVPPEVPTRLNIPESYGLIAAAHSELQNLADTIERNKPYSDLLMHMLNRREAVDSSQIEGTQTGFDGLLLHELENKDNAVESGNKDAIETFSYLRAYVAGSAAVKTQGKKALNETLLCEMHRILMANQLDSMSGLIRDRQNFIGLRLETATYIPPPTTEIPRLLKDLTRLMQYEADGVMEVSILIRAAIVHAQFEAIHPFLDGNGRVGRLILPLMFQAEGVPPIHLATFLKVRKREYYDALLAVQTRLDWKPWLLLFLECVIASSKQTIHLFDQLERLQNSWRDRLTAIKKRKDAASWHLVELLIAQPVITVNEVVKKTGVTFSTANQAIAELTELDILRPAKAQQRRDRVFHAHEVMNTLYTGLDKVLAQVAALRQPHF